MKSSLLVSNVFLLRRFTLGSVWSRFEHVEIDDCGNARVALVVVVVPLTEKETKWQSSTFTILQTVMVEYRGWFRLPSDLRTHELKERRKERNARRSAQWYFSGSRDRRKICNESYECDVGSIVDCEALTYFFTFLSSGAICERSNGKRERTAKTRLPWNLFRFHVRRKICGQSWKYGIVDCVESLSFFNFPGIQNICNENPRSGEASFRLLRFIVVQVHRFVRSIDTSHGWYRAQSSPVLTENKSKLRVAERINHIRRCHVVQRADVSFCRFVGFIGD